MASYNLTKLTFKLVFLGDHSVGKTSMIFRFIHDDFDTTLQPTVGVDFLSKIIHVDDKVVRLQLWDTAGQERFRSLIPGYIRDCNVAIIVYDITVRDTFNHVDEWIEQVKSVSGEDVLFVLVGNKTDEESIRAVTTEEGNEKAQRLGIMFAETSAKTGSGIQNLFQYKIAGALPGIDANTSNVKKQELDLKQTQENTEQGCPC